MNIKLLFVMVTFVAIFAVIAVFGSAVGGGNICNEGCVPDAKCSGDTPYLCTKSWSLDTCVAKGFDGGYCGGKTDKGGYCFECSGGCVAQSELGEQKCGLFTTCGPDEYCCRRADWYTSNVCKPKHSDMGCCGGPPTGGDRTTYLNINIGNNKPDACTDKVKWEVKAKGASEFVDYSTECVEGNPQIKIKGERSMTLPCTSQKLPTAATGPHTARVSWCGKSKEFIYGGPLAIPIIIENVGGDEVPPYETNDKTPLIRLKSNDNFYCKFSSEAGPYHDITEYTNGVYAGYLESPDIGAPGDKKVFIECLKAVGDTQTLEVDFKLLSEATPQCTTILDNGNPSDKLDILFIGCNYNIDELSEFISDVDTHSNAILSTVPFSDNKNKINVHRLNRFGLASCTPIDGTSLDASKSPATLLASRCPNDQIIVLVRNAGWNGISYQGGDFAMVSSGYSSISIHEFGHSFGGLNDEYIVAEGSPPSGAYPHGPNCDINPACPSWAGTPEDQGCYAGCTYESWYRPSIDSVMKHGILGIFNKVSIKALTGKLDKYT